jgi:hypothetical protein
VTGVLNELVYPAVGIRRVTSEEAAFRRRRGRCLLATDGTTTVIPPDWSDVPFVTFRDRDPNNTELSAMSVTPGNGLFAPFLQAVAWLCGGSRGNRQLSRSGGQFAKWSPPKGARGSKSRQGPRAWRSGG